MRVKPGFHFSLEKVSFTISDLLSLPVSITHLGLLNLSWERKTDGVIRDRDRDCSRGVNIGKLRKKRDRDKKETQRNERTDREAK